MKLTKTVLEMLVKEELTKVLEEDENIDEGIGDWVGKTAGKARAYMAARQTQKILAKLGEMYASMASPQQKTNFIADVANALGIQEDEMYRASSKFGRKVGPGAPGEGESTPGEPPLP